MESDLGWNNKAAEEVFWNLEDKGWGIRLTYPKRRCHKEVRSNKEDIDTTFKGTEPGFSPTDPSTHSPSSIRVPQKNETTGRDYFAYEGNGGHAFFFESLWVVELQHQMARFSMLRKADSSWIA